MHIFSKRILIIGFFIAIIWAVGGEIIHPTFPDDVFIEIDCPGAVLCFPDCSGECYDPYADIEPSENVKEPIKPPIFSRIFDAVDNYWSEMISKWWFEPAFSYLLLVLAVFMFESVRKVRNRQSPE
ncbi:MAG TPA: hypothetical protein VLA32_11410 [Anaerolineales bacterium]|jgi:hypothetical protein|nr:hypothetical protein [Anaerolineales bacterium]